MTTLTTTLVSRRSGHWPQYANLPSLNAAINVSQIHWDLRIDAFVRWARTLVITIIGKPALEFRSNNIPNNAKLQASVLAVDPLSYVNPSWSEFQCVIERALMDKSYEGYDSDSDIPKTDDIVKAIIRKLNDEATEWKGEAAKTLDYFKSLLQESEQRTTQGDVQLFPFQVGMHCEAVFATLVESYRGIGLNRNSLENDSEGDMALRAISVVRRLIFVLFWKAVVIDHDLHRSHKQQ